MKYTTLLFFICTCFNLQAQNFVDDTAEIQSILTKVDSFSSYYMSGNYEALANSYTEDGKIFPPGDTVISGTGAIQEKWIPPKIVKIRNHEVKPEEIIIIENTAYDWGYYSVTIEEGEEITRYFQGKYVIVWKKVEGDWKIYLDIWNRVGQ